MTPNKKIAAITSKKAQDDELEALFETFDKQYKDIEEKFQTINKQVREETGATDATGGDESPDSIPTPSGT